MPDMCKCIKCDYAVEHWGKGRLCKHPDGEKIQKYFDENNIKKMPGFIGFLKADGSFPVKKTPKWCPLNSGGSVKNV